jgi:mono/diheme cytochrome c family protein
MQQWLPDLKSVLCALLTLAFAGVAASAERNSAERGYEFLIQHSMTPALWSQKAYENAWKQWGLSARPANYAEAFRQRYGLHEAPFDNKGRPLGLLAARSLMLVRADNLAGTGIVNNCLLCHAGRVAGQTILGAPNAALDLQTLFEELSAAEGITLNLPFQFSYTRGTIDPVNPLTFLMQFREPDLQLRTKPLEFGFSRYVCSDPPAWWLLKKKKTRDWTGGVDVRSTRVDMVNLLSPLNSANYIKSQAGNFADISAYLLTVAAPRYPFAIDQEQAGRGRLVFQNNCSRCHGTYGKDGTYPNKIVELDVIGTDRTLAESLRPELGDYFRKSWLAQELGADGKPYTFTENPGYQAPPLDGVWATAPYFHNSSVPTIYHVLNSKARPKFFTRTYRSEKEDYDPAHLGLKFTAVDEPADSKLPAYERRKVYDTTLPGRTNTGHTFGDKLTEEQRMQVIEYLKTL